MKVLDPGHRYQLDFIGEFPDELPASEDQDYTHNLLQFVKRTGPNYPGNGDEGHDGTTTQEVIRVLIARTEYVNEQKSDKHNAWVFHGLRLALAHLELRAAEKRGDQRAIRLITGWLHLFEIVGRGMFDGVPTIIEKEPTCVVCGHILCNRHKTE